MGYNRFQWWTDGRYRKKPLPSTSPLIDRVKNGDFDYSPLWQEAKDLKREYYRMKNKFLKDKKYLIKSPLDRENEAHQHAKMKWLKHLKLREAALNDEDRRLMKLREALKKEYGKDYWDEVIPLCDGKIEDLIRLIELKVFGFPKN